MGNKVSKKEKVPEHHYVEIIEQKEIEYPFMVDSTFGKNVWQKVPLSRRALKVQQLHKQKNVKRVYRMELWQLSVDEFIVHGYIRDFMSQKKEEIPIDILDLIMKGVGYSYSNMKVRESCQQIIECVVKEPDPMAAYHNVFVEQCRAS